MSLLVRKVNLRIVRVFGGFRGRNWKLNLIVEKGKRVLRNSLVLSRIFDEIVRGYRIRFINLVRYLNLFIIRVKR